MGLEVVLACGRHRHAQDVPRLRAARAGHAHHAVDVHLRKLVQAGHGVAVCDQVADPASGQGLLRREVVRVLTPGTVIDEDLLDPRRPNHLAAVQEQPVEAGDEVLPVSMIQGTRPYIEKLTWQINGCYNYEFYDGCAVLMRRLVESLLVEAFIKTGHDDKIRHGQDTLGQG